MYTTCKDHEDVAYGKIYFAACKCVYVDFVKLLFLRSDIFFIDFVLSKKTMNQFFKNYFIVGLVLHVIKSK